ncbi:MAG: gliding motility-associated C-terminal domain-containing protein, partial [Bacteroidota bacterium]
TLNLTVNPTSTGLINATICSNQTYLFNGVSRNTTGTYLDTFVNFRACDSVVTLNLTVNPTTTGTINATICSNQTYLFNGINRNITGVYLDTFINFRSCDSVVTLNLTVNLTSTGTINTTICSNQYYLFNGVNRNTTGTYLDTFVNFRGCDSVVTLNLTVNPTSTGTINATICSNQTYLFNGVNRNTSGTYLDTIINSRGCDSFLTLNLTVNPTSTGTINATICSNQTYLFNGVNRNTTGAYLDTFVNFRGCDSVVTLNLTVNPTTTGIINATICSNQTYLFNGINRNTTGVYIDTFVNFRGCDSVVTLNLTVLLTSTGIINQSICAGSSYFFNGVNRTLAGSYLDTLISINGCDSFLTLNLTIRNVTSGSINQVLCFGSNYLFNGVNRSVSGIYQDTLIGVNGCDSFLTLNLTIRGRISSTINQTICYGTSYLFNGVNLNIAGTYEDTLISNVGCDSFLTLNLSIGSFIFSNLQPIICEGDVFVVGTSVYSIDGSYRDTLISSTGCDSIVFTNLMVIPRVYQTQSFVLCLGQSITIGIHTYNTSGVYTDTFVSSVGCDSVLTTNLILQNPIIQRLDTTICSGSMYDGVVYTSNTVYNDTVLYSNIGCDSIILNIHIVVLPNIPIQVSTDTIICDGMNVLLDAYGGYTGIYTWTPSSYLSCGICPNPIANPPVGTFNYIVSSTDCEGNIISENVNVIVQSLPLINILNQDTCIYLGQVLDIVAQTDSIANTDVNWSIGNLNLCLDCSTYHFQPYITGSYIAMAYDTFGCTNADTFDICIINECGDTTIQLPNYITPNNDGFNDIFRMENPQNLPITFMRIFNRWGEMIYEAFGNNATWDATYINKPVNPGVYVYYIEGVCSSGGRFVKTGNLSVIK